MNLFVFPTSFFFLVFSANATDTLVQQQLSTLVVEEEQQCVVLCYSSTFLSQLASSTHGC